MCSHIWRSSKMVFSYSRKKNSGYILFLEIFEPNGINIFDFLKRKGSYQYWDHPQNSRKKLRSYSHLDPYFLALTEGKNYNFELLTKKINFKKLINKAKLEYDVLLHFNNFKTYQKFAFENCSMKSASSVNGVTCKSPCVGNILPASLYLSISTFYEMQ